MRHPNGLTPRQTEIMARRARGQTILAISIDMGISTQTVKNHVSVVYAKTGALCFADALVALGWLNVPEPEGVAA